MERIMFVKWLAPYSESDDNDTANKYHIHTTYRKQVIVHNLRLLTFIMNEHDTTL